LATADSTNLTGTIMNARNLVQAPIALAVPPAMDEDGIDLIEYWDIIVDNRWVIASITALALVIGIGYAVLARPIYESNLLIQVEDSAGSTKNLFGDAANLFDIKTPAAGEMEILRSRMVIGRAVDATKIYIQARPRYIPVVGTWLARHSTGLSNPGFLGLSGYVSGTEKIKVDQFDVPASFEGSKFRVTAAGDGNYVLSHPDLERDLAGKVGVPLVASVPTGTVSLLVSSLEGKSGAQFDLIRQSDLAAVEALQANLKLAEKGRQSGVIEATMQSADPKQLTTILNEIGRQYVHQNVERKAAEAEKMLAFLDVQMPQFKKQLDQSEAAYSRYRNEKGTISLDEEAKAVLQQQVDLQSKLMDAKLKRMDLVSRFTAAHPAVRTLDEQIASWNREIERLNARVRTMPTVQENAVRLQRDVVVNNDAYQNLRNNAIQLQLMREGKVGNVRLIDDAAYPEAPVKPKRSAVVGIAAALGVLCGLAFAFTRNAFFRGIRSPQEVEAYTGLNVYSTIPLSPAQDALARNAAARRPGLHLLASQAPSDAAVESLRSLRTALQFAMLDAQNNRVLVTGATPSVGKSFVSSNFAVILANAGKRVLLIDADMRKGHLNHYFGVPRERGLSDLIAGSITISEAIRRELIPNLDLLTTGILPPNPAELMMSGAFALLLEQLSRNYDVVILDTPPVLVAADTVGIAPQAATVLLVARAGLTQVGELQESAKRLSHAGRTVSGVLFNAIDLSQRHYGSYGYKYGGYRYRQYSYEPMNGR
jgi:tyrosine-protein kinase Etk/Wzc